ncbi:MAG: metallophosphoesterase [Novosphingobium sp.]
MGETTVLFHVSDLHFGDEDRGALDWFAAEVAGQRPAAVLCTGDLTMRGTAREFAAAEEYLRALPVPVSMVPGNHDVPYYYSMLRRLTRPFARYLALEQAIESELLLGDVAVVPLDTVAAAQWRLNWSKGRVTPGGLDTTLTELAALADKPLRLVTCHHPLTDAATRSSGSTRGGRRALVALAKAGADAVLSGHVHDPFDLTLDAEGRTIRMIGAGTLSQRLRATRPSFNRLEWSAAAGLKVDVQAMV